MLDKKKCCIINTSFGVANLGSRFLIDKCLIAIITRLMTIIHCPWVCTWNSHKLNCYLIHVFIKKCPLKSQNLILTKISLLNHSIAENDQ